jgi:hypothetical protein
MNAMMVWRCFSGEERDDETHSAGKRRGSRVRISGAECSAARETVNGDRRNAGGLCM